MNETYGFNADDFMWAFDPSSRATTTYHKIRADFIAGIGPKPPFPGEESPQNKIDRLVKETLEKPKLEAEEKRQQEEVARRVELAEKLSNWNFEFGAVLRWTRKLGKDTQHTQAKEYRYAAIKAGDGMWYVTGENQAKRGGWKWDALMEWMITGENTIENLQVATAWEDIF